MFLSLISQWKAYVVSLAALTATISPFPASISQSGVPTANNIPAAIGTSRNWSGYSATNGQFTSVSGNWTIPSVTGYTHTSADATWIGIGGISSNDLIQTGTQNIVTKTGEVSTAAFYELLPNASQRIPVPIKSGDFVSFTLTQTTNGQWKITCTDATTSDTFSTLVSYSSSLSSAEWIEEAPSTGHSILPLDTFSTLSFSNLSTTENGANMNLSQSNAHAVTMINNSNQILATPSPVGSDNQSFTVTRTTNQTNGATFQYDQNPFGFRRHGIGIGGYRSWQLHHLYPRSIPQISPTITGYIYPVRRFPSRFSPFRSVHIFRLHR